MKLPQTILYLLVFFLGAVSGFTLRQLMIKQPKHEMIYTERHEGQSRFINPLLGCDVAADVLSDPELVGFKKKIEQVVDASKSQGGHTSVYFRELNDGVWFSIGERDQYIPASLRKVPLMMALLKQGERDRMFLGRSVTFDLANDYNASQNFKPSKSLQPGSSYRIRDLIFRMIAYSDNNAFFFLTKLVNTAELDKVYAALRFQDPGENVEDNFLSVQTYMSFFRVLYNASYLSRESSDWALETLAQSEFKAGLVAGVPPDIMVAHKFGEKSDPQSGQFQLHDCGIVYYPKHPYLLCVMSKGNDFKLLDDEIVAVSRTIYSEVDNQHKQHYP